MFISVKNDRSIFVFFCCKMRNSETATIALWEKHSVMNYNKGIFIDLFPVDIVPDNEVERNSFYIACKKNVHL